MRIKRSPKDFKGFLVEETAMILQRFARELTLSHSGTLPALLVAEDRKVQRLK